MRSTTGTRRTTGGRSRTRSRSSTRRASASSPSSSSRRPRSRRPRSPRRRDSAALATETRPRLLVPGLVPFDPTRETYRVAPGETTMLALEPGDRLTVCDVHGGQRAILVSEELGLATELFGPESPAGRGETFDAARAAVVSISAPAGEPVVEGGVPASDLRGAIRRATPRE